MVTTAPRPRRRTCCARATVSTTIVRPRRASTRGPEAVLAAHEAGGDADEAALTQDVQWRRRSQEVQRVDHDAAGLALLEHLEGGEGGAGVLEDEGFEVLGEGGLDRPLEAGGHAHDVADEAEEALYGVTRSLVLGRLAEEEAGAGVEAGGCALEAEEELVPRFELGEPGGEVAGLRFEPLGGGAAALAHHGEAVALLLELAGLGR